MKKLLFIIGFLFCALYSYCQLPNNQSVSNALTRYHIPNMKADSSIIYPIKDTLNNPATFYPGAMTVRPQDTIGHAIFPIYQSNGIYWSKVSSSIFITGLGIDSITLYNGELCQWQGGTRTCWFLTPGTGGSVDSFHLSPDSLAIYQYRNGAFIDSIYLLHTYLYVDGHFSLTPNYGGNPYAQLLNATRLIDTTYATPDSLYLITRYGDGDIDSTQWIGDGGGGGGGGGGSGITALTGDVTASGTGSVAATLATVNSNVGSFRNTNLTVNGKGLITAASDGITTFAGLDDVTITSPLNNQIPVYNSGTLDWENKMPVLFSLAGLRNNDYLMYDSVNTQFYNTRAAFTGSTTTKKMLVVDTITRLFYYAEIPTLANNSWALAGNAAIAGTDFLGTTNNTSLNIRTNNIRYAQLDSLGAFNIFPGATPKSAFNVYRNSSTTVKALELKIVGNAPIFQTTNDELDFFTIYNSGSQSASLKLMYQTPTATRASSPQAIVMGKLESEIAIPSGTEYNYGLQITNLTPLARLGLGIDVNENVVIGVGNTDLRIVNDNTQSGVGDYLRLYAKSGNAVFQTRGTATQIYSSRMTVNSVNQGILIPRMTTTRRDNIPTSISTGSLTLGGTGYTNGSYSAVALTGGTGSGATADITVAGGIVTIVVITDPGVGYTASDDLSSASIGGGSGFVWDATTVSGITKGLLVNDTTTDQLSYYNGTNWTNSVTSSSAGTLTLAHGNDYAATGTTTTWTLPAVSTTIQGRQNMITIKNAGSGNITLNSSGGGNDIYNTSAVNTLTIAAGASVILMPIGSIFYVE